MNNNSVTIIGGGLGGLICGAILSKEGYSVRVLEKHSTAGGGLHMFCRNGIWFETGLHYLGGLQENGLLNKLFNYLGIYQKMQYKMLDEDGFDRVLIGTDNATYHLGRGKENFINLLSAVFPAETDAIRGYVNAIYDICNKIPLSNLELPENSLLFHSFGGENIPIDRFIAGFTQNKELQAILSWNSLLYSGKKGKTPIFVAALITKMYIEGASRMIGGGKQIADALSGIITGNGGEILLNKEVTRIHIDDRMVKSVTTSDSNTYTSDAFISSLNPAKMISISDEHSFSKSYIERALSVESSDSMFTLFVIFKPKSFKYLNYNQFFYRDYSCILDEISYNEDTFPDRLMAMTPPEEDDPLWARKMIIHCPMKYSAVSKWADSKVGHRGAEYLEFKENNSVKIISRMNELFPGFASCIDSYFSSTPLTIRDYLGNEDGASYGRVFDCSDYEKSYLSTKTKIANLYLTGQYVRMHGICGVPITALETCSRFIGMEQLISAINSTTVRHN